MQAIILKFIKTMLKKLLYLNILFLSLISISGYPQTEKAFSEDAFLINNNKKVTIYSDSIGNNILSTISNDEKIDKYYLFQILNISNNRIKVLSKYTIDAGQNDSSIIIGWINYNSIGIYVYNSRVNKPFLFTSFNRNSKKIFIDESYLFNPSKILKIKYVDNKPWFKTVIKLRTKEFKYGWIPPEMQCTDIWNACRGN